MFKAAPALVLVLLAAMQVVASDISPIVRDIVKHAEAAKMMERALWQETADADLTAEEEVTSTSTLLTLPYLPKIIYLGGVSMCFIDISITGPDPVSMLIPAALLPTPPALNISIPITVPSLSFNAGSYISGGRLNNLPFVGTGSGSAKIGLTNLSILLSFELQGLSNWCPKANSTVFDMTLERLSMNFEDLNPGQDSGVLINAILNSLTVDVTKFINLLMNEQAGKELLERLIGFVVSKRFPIYDCTSEYSTGDDLQGGLGGQGEYSSGDALAHDLQGGLGGQGGLGDHGNYLAESTQVLKTVISMLSGLMEIPEEAESFIELVGDLLPEIDLGNADFTR